MISVYILHGAGFLRPRRGSIKFQWGRKATENQLHVDTRFSGMVGWRKFIRHGMAWFGVGWHGIVVCLWQPHIKFHFQFSFKPSFMMHVSWYAWADLNAQVFWHQMRKNCFHQKTQKKILKLTCANYVVLRRREPCRSGPRASLPKDRNLN